MSAKFRTKVSYLGYAAMLFLVVIYWLMVLLRSAIYAFHSPVEEPSNIVDYGREDAWFEIAVFLSDAADYVIFLSVVCAVLAFASSVLPAGKAATAKQDYPLYQSHRAYQRRYGTIALCFLLLFLLTLQPFGFYLEIAAVAVLAWSSWIIVKGWRALAGERIVTGPPAWWLGLAANLLFVAGVVALLAAVELVGLRLR
ncbi:hypothetical protein HBA54_20285 [Pelagibius litoralis]|uniref:Uncharacterized protein n=1 Tax=Pelagibius litoralis TaxID=374515 RepID=A0A967F0U6_9PROT|nr:hypothetical protein [Pelagibius litoralis]NIA70943.1 hypothetical protein [Pelagibius litoralis]